MITLEIFAQLIKSIFEMSVQNQLALNRLHIKMAVFEEEGPCINNKAIYVRRHGNKCIGEINHNKRLSIIMVNEILLTEQSCIF